MANIQIYADLEDAAIHFDGSTVTPKSLGSILATAHPTESTRIKISRIKLKPDGSERVYFKRFDMNRVENKDGVQLASLGYDRDAVVAYLNVEFTKTLVQDTASYRGVWDASTNTPALADLTPANGDFLYVTTAGTFETVDYAINDTVRYNGGSSSWDKIQDQAAKVTDIEDSAKGEYDVYVDPDFVGTSSGSILRPYSDLLIAINNTVEGDRLFIKGSNSIAAEITLPHTLHFYGAELSEIKYAAYDASNGDIFSFTGTDHTKTFTFKNIAFKNAGGYGLYIKKTAKIVIENCTFLNNGWDGTALHTVLASGVSGVLGYDSTNTDLQAFYAGANASNGGATRIEEATQLLVIGNTVKNNLRGIRVSDCGVNGGGFITRNQSTQNIESGIYLSVGSLGGCQNITVTMNVSAYNANNGLLVIGGINNKFSQNEVNGNWNAGFCAWGAANSTLRDCGLYDNNRSQYNGIGNAGDAKASIQINDAYNLLGTSITYNPAFRFIAEILDTQVHYTGLGSNTEKIGFLITSAVGAIADNPKNIIKVDDVGFIGQDYAIDLSEVDISNLRLSLGDNSYQSIGINAVKAPSAGNYSELPFSNHVMEVPEVDIVVDTLKMTIALHEGVGGNVINIYNVNELQSVLKANSVDIIQKGTDKIQLRDLTLGNVYINGVAAGSNISTMNDSINSALDMTLIEYKDFIESEVGVVGGGGTATATYYYIESPDGVFHYPLFKTEAEANTFDTANGGTGTNHTHTYVDDATNTTWYMPTSLGVMDGTSAPVNGSYGNSVSIIWNVQVTEADSSYAPTFTDIVYTIQEQSAVNVQYKPMGDPNTYSLSTLPAGYADNGYAIIGTAETITDGIDIQHAVTVTKANGYGSTVGTITLNVTDDAANNVSAFTGTTPYTKAVEFNGSNNYVERNWYGGNWNTIAMRAVNNLDGTDILINANGTKTSNSTTGGSMPWMSAIVFNCQDVTSNGQSATSSNNRQYLWFVGRSPFTVGNGKNISVYIENNGDLYLDWGGLSGVLEMRCKIATISSDTWYGLNIGYTGARISAASLTPATMAQHFDIRLTSAFGAMGTNQSVAGSWTVGSSATTNSNAVGGTSSKQTVGAPNQVAGATGNFFRGKIASHAITTLRAPQGGSDNPADAEWDMPNDTEIQLFMLDNRKWVQDYRITPSTTQRGGAGSYLNFPGGETYSYIMAQGWEFGDGPDDVFPNYKNASQGNDNSYTIMQFKNGGSNNQVNVTIPGLS